jgi:hypothetical protein
MYDIISLEDLKEKLAAEMDEFWFVDYFEVSIEDLIKAFEDRLEERREEVAIDLGYIEKVEEYDDRED